MHRLTFALLILLACGDAWARDKTDIVWMTNGDRVTGEIKQLQHGKLRLNTDSMGEIRIEWADIERIESDFPFQFERTDGSRVTGTIDEEPGRRGITVTEGEDGTSFEHDEVVRISPIEDSFWDRLNGSLSFGYSFTKASDVANGNLGIRATHRSEIRSLSLDGSTIITRDQADESTQDSKLSFTMTRFRPNRWFNSYFLGVESNDEMGLNLRSSLGAGVGRYLVQSNTSELALIGGLIGSDESRSGESSRQNLEGLVGLSYSRYIYDQPTVDLSVDLAAFPSITESGRKRAELDVSLRWEVINDLFWDLSYYHKYDSDAATGGESTSDYGIVTSLGWSY